MNVSDTPEFKRIIQRYPNICHSIGEYLDLPLYNEMEKSLKVIRFFGKYVHLFIINEHSGCKELEYIPRLNKPMEEERTTYQDLMTGLLFQPSSCTKVIGITYMYYLSLFDDKQYKYGKKIETKLICHPSIKPYYADFYMIKCNVCNNYQCHTVRRYPGPTYDIKGDPTYR